MKLIQWLALGGSAMAAVGCGDDEVGPIPPPFSENEMLVTCLVGDPTCDGANPGPVTDPTGLTNRVLVGVGGQFDIDGATGWTNGIIEPHDAGGLTFTRSGIGAVIGFKSMLHLHAREPAAIRIEHEDDPSQAFFVDVTDKPDFAVRFPTDRFRAYLIDAEGYMLVGTYENIQWESDNPSIVTIEGRDDLTVVTTRIENEGQATVTITIGDFTGTLDFDIVFE